MPRLLPVGTTVTVEVPATSANLGPGFDCFGLALDWSDTVNLTVSDGVAIEVTGEGSAEVPDDDSHLIVRAAQTAFDDLGLAVPGLTVRAHHTIPHGRGLGSSSAAIVAGLAGAAALAGQPLDAAWLVGHAAALEGHPDNVAAAVYGGFVLAFRNAAGTIVVTSAPVDVGIVGGVFVPAERVSTTAARGLLPATVPHAAAAANAGRAALLVQALSGHPELLFEGTRDWLHQSFRAPAMPTSYALVQSLRAAGHAAAISGAGPTVLVLGPAEDRSAWTEQTPGGFAFHPVNVGRGVRVVAPRTTARGEQVASG